MKITIKIDADGDAFTGRTHAEVARILKELADSIDYGIPTFREGYPYSLKDTNGNTVGEMTVK